MRFLNGSFALIGGFVGLVLLISGINNYSLDFVSGTIFVLLIANGLWATYRKIRGFSANTDKKGPLSSNSKRKSD